MAQVVVLGLGYVGITQAVGLSALGHSVVGIDINEQRVQDLQLGNLPIHEPGLQELMQEMIGTGLLSFSKTFDDARLSTEFAFVCVPTPSSASMKIDLSYVESAIELVTPKLHRESIVVMKSTLPIGTGVGLATKCKNLGIQFASNPEFLSEGTALIDFRQPSRIVVGAESEEVAEKVMSLYQNIDSPKVVCDITSAETIKHASNSFLAIKLSYVNELAALCEKTGASMKDVVLGMSLDSRIGGKFLKSGPGWGGSCFPKDTEDLAKTARSFGANMPTLEGAIASNKQTITRIIDHVVAGLGGSLEKRKVAVWGISYKANVGDIRGSTALEIANSLQSLGATVEVFDPLVTQDKVPGIRLNSSPIDACVGASALLVLTEWDVFQKISPAEVKGALKDNPFVIDTRHVLDLESWSLYFDRLISLGR